MLPAGQNCSQDLPCNRRQNSPGSPASEKACGGKSSAEHRVKDKKRMKGRAQKKKRDAYDFKESKMQKVAQQYAQMKSSPAKRKEAKGQKARQNRKNPSPYEK